MSLTKVQSGMLGSIDATALSGVVPAANGGTGSTAGTANFKNRLINGNMKIWQRGTSGTSIGTSEFGPDRWRNYGGNALTLTQSTGFGSPQSLLIQANNTNHAIGQRIEAANISDLAGQTVTISYQIRADNPGTHKLLMYYANSSDNWSGETNFVNTSISYTSNTVTTVTYTTTLPSQAANGISVVLQWYNGGATINLTAFVWNVQIEAGSSATNFDVRDYASEFTRCQRYFERSYDTTSATGSFSAGWRGTSTVVATNGAEGPGWAFTVPKRTGPTVTFYQAVSGAAGYGYQVSTAASIAVSARYVGQTGVGILDYASSGGSNSYWIHFTASAEL